ncbi:SNF2 family N-terminal domain-containing protein [Halteromyces radiatus]|uniref:SNF2 family N-terminal domain-containing protein n=1 Tax=Halteromyces radiatus TaxID=101107 RepID=UPI0022205494|nr:SNF2 family N-terminal domain-containing protein [Halteromyces radiatus]KAI8089312.1 SNF2 family N-terminal domain-containing protein [Halteromyces radiatus]
MTNRNICIGMLKSDVVTKDPLFLVKDELFEPVLMRMEGYRQNNYSFTITSKKNPTKFYGWVPFDDTSILGPIAERQMVWWDTVIPRNKANMTRTPLYIILYCRPNVYDKLCQYLFKWKLDLQDPPFFNPACRYSNPKFSKNNLIPQQEQQRESFTTTGTMYHSNSSNNNDSNSYLGQAKRGITQLLESIPSHRQGDKGNRPIVINDEEGDATYKDDNDEPQNEIKEDDLNMKGLTITLLPHQLEGIRWMMDREENESSSGGILADDMGLGKTIQTIGLVTSTLENTEKRENKTLIVAPLALIQQWAREFEMKTTPGNIKVLIHHGGDRTKNHRDFDDYDVVVTTYQIVASDLELSGTGKKRGRQQQQQQQPIVIGEDASMIETIDDGTNFESDVSASSSRLASPAPSSSAGQQQRYSEDDDDKDNKVSTLDCGPLFQVQWYRVVLDEAQQIKNHKTRSSIACSKLISSKRWCLTGTPIQNRVDELYSLLRFLRIQPLCELATFRHTISGPIQSGKVDIALGRLKAILMVIMLRRTKQILNATSSASSSSSPKVPTSSSSASSPPPTTTTNSSGSSTPTETSSSLVFGLPCRQKEDILLEFSSNERALYDVLIRKTKSTVERLVQSGKGTRNYMNMLCMLLRLRQACNHPDLVLRSLSNDEDIMAFASAENSSTTTSSSKRETSEAAMQRLLMAQMAADLGWSGVGQVGQSVFDKSSSKHQCELCGRPVIVMDSEETCGNNNNNMTNTPPYCVNCTNQIKLYTNKATSTISMNSASTKINKMLEILEETRQHYPNEKTIIFSQFSSMLDLMEKPLQGLGFKFCRYDGSMANHAREKSLHVLRTDPECRVMLISLKCGSLGLNLTAANRVILMDIWWNPAVEDQAIDRVHRIGQKLPVYVTRLLIDRTIEQKIIKLQEHKARIAKGALGDHMTGTNKLTTQELLALFDL